ncbi:hypothetical protein [Streptomyces pulveraceus]|uniref:ESX secretion-associated protein EspG n=1 Tax=Streptomyces pulveraceus TaxID=68258 RepID=A0ABW1GK78_9ACTN
MHDHVTSERLASYADILASELPGTWTSTHHPAEHKAYLADLTDRVWDLNLVAESLAEHPLQQAAVLSRSDGAQFVVIDHHDDPDGFLIAAVAPRNLPDEAYRRVREPNGIALSDNPFQAVEQITGKLLSRYETSLAQVRYKAIENVQPSQADQVVLTWQRDGSLAATAVGVCAAAVLTDNGFVLDGAGAYRLSGEDTTAQAHAVREIAPQLEAHGIATTIQHPSGRIAPRTASPTTQSAPAVPRSTTLRSR